MEPTMHSISCKCGRTLEMKRRHCYFYVACLCGFESQAESLEELRRKIKRVFNEAF